MSWARSRPTPLRTAQLDSLDTLGRSKPMIVQTWAWLIGMSDADDGGCWTGPHSYANPPALDVEGHGWRPNRTCPSGGRCGWSSSGRN